MQTQDQLKISVGAGVIAGILGLFVVVIGLSYGPGAVFAALGVAVSAWMLGIVQHIAWRQGRS